MLGGNLGSLLYGDVSVMLVKMLIPLELHGMIGSNFVCLCILTLSATGMKKCDKASQNIILAGRALLVKMFITLELRGIFVQILYTMLC